MRKTNRATITTRQLLLDAVQTVREGGDPPAIGEGYYTIRALEKILPRNDQWHERVSVRYRVGDAAETNLDEAGNQLLAPLTALPKI